MNKMLCLLVLLSACIVPKPIEPGPVPPTSKPLVPELNLKFSPYGPVDDQLYVCGLVEGGDFWCLEYRIFEEQMKWRTRD